MLILLPGPPFELEGMFNDHCFERLKLVLPEEHLATCELKIAMVPNPARTSAPQLSTSNFPRSRPPSSRTRARCNFISRRAAQVRRRPKSTSKSWLLCLRTNSPTRSFPPAASRLEQIVGYFLQMRGATLSVAESCTGGLLAERITRISGSSRYFIGGALVYSDQLKREFCGVPPLLLASDGAVSRSVAAALAEGIRQRCKTTLGIGITGIAGPGGGTDEKPVGLVYIALADGKHTEVVERRFPGDRDRVRWFATQLALDLLRRKLR